MPQNGHSNASRMHLQQDVCALLVVQAPNEGNQRHIRVLRQVQLALWGAFNGARRTT
jgi:hypothetical protein